MDTRLVTYLSRNIFFLQFFLIALSCDQQTQDKIDNWFNEQTEYEVVEDKKNDLDQEVADRKKDIGEQVEGTKNDVYAWINKQQISMNGSYRTCALLTLGLTDFTMKTFDGYEPVHADVVSYCENYTLSDKQGDADFRQEEIDTWVPSLGSAFKVLVLDNTKGYMPKVKRTLYKEIDECKLSMRVYKVDENQTNLKPIILLHGGGWGSREGSIATLDAYAAVFANRGYVVFAPFYRLNGDLGPVACRNSTIDQINSDVEDALDWVLKNGATYGVDISSQKVSVAGGSAGGHLAGYLGVYHPEKIDKAIMIYPATDFGFLQEKASAYLDLFELGSYAILETFDVTVEEFMDPEKLNATIKQQIEQNSFPGIVKEKLSSKIALPTFYLLHGAQDRITPLSMSTRMCEALGSKTLSDEAFPVPMWGENTCDTNGSKAFYSELGYHGMDINCFLEGNTVKNIVTMSKRAGIETTETEVVDILLPGNLSKNVFDVCKAGGLQEAKKVRAYLESILENF